MVGAKDYGGRGGGVWFAGRLVTLWLDRHGTVVVVVVVVGLGATSLGDWGG